MPTTAKIDRFQIASSHQPRPQSELSSSPVMGGRMRQRAWVLRLRQGLPHRDATLAAVEDIFAQRARNDPMPRRLAELCPSGSAIEPASSPTAHFPFAAVASPPDLS